MLNLLIKGNPDIKLLYLQVEKPIEFEDELKIFVLFTVNLNNEYEGPYIEIKQELHKEAFNQLRKYFAHGDYDYYEEEDK